MLLFFDFLSVVDHAHHSMAEASQDHFIELSMDVDWVVKEFSYADELQDKAKEKKRKREMIINLISGALLASTAITGGASLWGGAITSGVSKWMAKAPFSRLAGVAGKASKGGQNAARGVKLPGKGVADQLGNLNSAAGGIITGGFIGVTGLLKEAQNIKHGDDE
jgi:hypothetical protein